MTKPHTKPEQLSLQSFLKAYPVNLPDIEEAERLYQRLYEYIASRLEINFRDMYLPYEQNEKIKQDAHEQACVFVCLFGDYERTVSFLRSSDYLENYYNEFCFEPNIVLPASPNWDVALWRSIIVQQSPASKVDLIIRLVPHFAHIENHVAKNRDSIQAQIEQDVLQEYREAFAEKYAKTSNFSKADWLEAEISKRGKIISKQVTHSYDLGLRTHLHMSPSGKLPAAQLLMLKNRKQYQTEMDEQQHEAVAAEVKAQFREKLERKFSGINPDITKEAYIAACMQQDAKLIAAVTRQRQQRILFSTISMARLMDFAKYDSYTRAKENPEVAKLFFKHKVEEEYFNKYLDWVPHDDPKQIPPIEIDGNAFGAPGFRLAKLSPFDPMAAVLGHETGCCQNIDDTAKESVEFGITDPSSGFYVLYKGNDIVSQCWAWRGMDGALVIDSIETRYECREKYNTIISDAFMCLAEKLVQEHEVPRVVVGTGQGETPGNLRFMPAIIPARFAEYNGYSDAVVLPDERDDDFHGQYLLAQANFPLRQAYQKHNQLEVQPFSGPITKRQRHAWYDHCLFEESISDRESYAADLIGTKKGFRKRKKLLEKFSAFVGEWSPALDEQQVLAGLKKYVKRGLNVNMTNALKFAVLRHFSDVADYLIDHGADVNYEEVLIEVVKQANATRNLSILLKFVEKGANFRNIFSLYYQIEELTYISLISVLYHFGARIAENNYYDLVERGSVELISFFFNHLSDVNSYRGLYQRSLLHFAVSRGEENPVAILLAKGANVNAEDNEGRTPLFHAFENASLPMIKMLLAAGADVNCADKEGRLPIFHMCQKQTAVGIRYVLNYLKLQGVDLNVRDKYGCNLLHWAVHRGEQEKVRVLLELGVDHTVKNNDGYMPLGYVNNCLDSGKAIKALLEKAAGISNEEESAATLSTSKNSIFARKKAPVHQAGIDSRHRPCTIM